MNIQTNAQKAKTSANPSRATFEYTVNAKGWVAGQNRKAGETVWLTLDQAKYENVTAVTKKTTKAADKK